MPALQAPRPGDAEAGAPRFEMTVRLGVTFPDWSAVESETVRTALGAIFEAFGIDKCWTDYGEAEDGVRRAVLEPYRASGSAPSLERLCAATGMARDEALAQLHSLWSRDLVVLDDAGTAITGAYPLTDRATEHRVHFGPVVVNAMCAIDALGAGAMYGEDVAIESSCRACGAPIGIRTRAGGMALAAFEPAGAVVWSGIENALGCAATSLCPVIAFFCSDAHLRSWRDAEHSGVNGYRLTMDKGRQARAAIFVPMLAPASADA